MFNNAPRGMDEIIRLLNWSGIDVIFTVLSGKDQFHTIFGPVGFFQ